MGKIGEVSQPTSDLSLPSSPYSLPIHHSLVRRGSHGSRSGAVCQGLIGSGRMLLHPNAAFLQMRISLPGCGLLFAGLLFYFLLVAGGCSAHAAHESPVSSIASLTSMLKAKIPATLDQAAKDYNVARSMFQRCARISSCLSQTLEHASMYITHLSGRQCIDPKARNCFPRGMKCGGQPCLKRKRLCVLSLLRYVPQLRI